MKKTLICCFIFITLTVFSNTRDIYVGDLITLNVTGISKEEILKNFENSDIVIEKINPADKGFILLIRPLTVGEHKIKLRNNNLTFKVKTTLTEKERKGDIYKHLSNNQDLTLYKGKFPFYFLIFSIIGLFSLFKLLKIFKLKEKRLSADVKFHRVLNNLSDENWHFELSLAIREYIDAIYHTHFKNGIYTPVKDITIEDVNFLEKLDKLKFSQNMENVKVESIKQAENIYLKLKGGK